MDGVGIERLGFYGGEACLDVMELARHRGLDAQRLKGLMMRRKSLSLPFEDPVCFAANACAGMLAGLPPRDRDAIEMVVVASESGVDFGKSMSTYLQRHLELHRRCRSFEVKQACYGGTAALLSAVDFVRLNPGRKALVVCTDLARPLPHSYAEVSQGAAALAMLIGWEPALLRIEARPRGYHSYEVMDTFRPTPYEETGDPDLSLLTYLDCLENCLALYRGRNPDLDLMRDFGHLLFHTPFPAMVMGAHRNLLRKGFRMDPASIDADFRKRVLPGLDFAQEVGNVYSGSLYLCLLSLLATRPVEAGRVGLFSYGSGCSSEFFGGILGPAAGSFPDRPFREALGARHPATLEEYESLLPLNREILMGRKDIQIGRAPFEHIHRRNFQGKGRLVLKGLQGYHREYAWV